MAYFLGIDLGASSLKACLIDRQGHRLALIRAPIETHRPSTGFSEQNPTDWLEAMTHIIGRLGITHGAEIAQLAGISFSGGAHIGVLCDTNHRPLRAAIMWDDQRARAEAARLAAKGEVEAITGNRPNATWTLPQLVWLATHEPDIIGQTKKLFFAKDWLRAQLTGSHSSDSTEAVGAMLADRKGAWSPPLQQLSGMGATAFPPLLAPHVQAGVVTASAAENFALPPNVPVYQGAIDTSMEWLCVAPQSATMASVKLASAGVLAFTTDKPNSFAPVSFYPHIMPGRFYHAAGMSDCMGAIDWVRQNFTPQLSPRQFGEAAQSAPVGADSLLFYPYLSGARAPFWDADLRAEMHGLTRAHGTASIARAAYEGVAHVLAAIWHDMTTRLGQTPDFLHVLGGGAQQHFFCQILADMMNVDLRAGVETDCAFATALQAATTAGNFTDLSHGAQTAYTQKEQFIPDKAAHAVYGGRHEAFMSRHMSRYGGAGVYQGAGNGKPC